MNKRASQKEWRKGAKASRKKKKKSKENKNRL